VFEEILVLIAEVLSRRSIPYLVVGGQAVLLHGEPRLTRDIDVTLAMGPDRTDDLLALAAEMGLSTLPENPRSFIADTLVLPALHERTGVRVDFILAFTPYEEQAMDRAAVRTLRGQEVRFASAEDTLLLKLFAGRPRDLEDGRSILVRNPSLDLAYVRRWLAVFDESTDLQGGRNLAALLEEILGDL
jgi:hypothetical protein